MTLITTAAGAIPVTAGTGGPCTLRPFFVIAVISNMYSYDAVSFKCHNFIYSAIQEITIMRYYKHSSRELIQISLENA
ncbi:hypothetical protein D3C73_735780 [compost metagenome]